MNYLDGYVEEVLSEPMVLRMLFLAKYVRQAQRRSGMG